MNKFVLSISVFIISVPLMAQTGLGSGVNTTPTTGNMGVAPTDTTSVGAPSSAPNNSVFGSQDTILGNQGTVAPGQGTSFGTPATQQRMEDTTNPGSGLGGGAIGTSTAPGGGTSFGTGTNNFFGTGSNNGIGTGLGTGTGVGTGTSVPTGGSP